MYSSDMRRPSRHPNERVLHEVLGEIAITAQEIGESDGGGRTPEVGLFQEIRGEASFSRKGAQLHRTGICHVVEKDARGGDSTADVR